MADPPASLALAAAAGESALKEAVQGALSLPHYQGPRIPTSWSEAQAIAQARDEARLKQKETNSKSKGHKPQFQAQDPAQTQPGVSIGSIGDAAPFWMFVEEYFRGVACQDIMLLVPKWLDISQDDAFYVPELGSPPQQAEDGMAAPSNSKLGVGGSSAGGHGPGSGRRAAQAARNLILSEMETDQPERRSGRHSVSGRQGLLSDDAFLQKLPEGSDALSKATALNGLRMATMLQACDDAEVNAITQFLTKLGLLAAVDGSRESPVDEAAALSQLTALQSGSNGKGHSPLPLLASLSPEDLRDRQCLEAILQRVGQGAGDKVVLSCKDSQHQIEGVQPPTQQPGVWGGQAGATQAGAISAVVGSQGGAGQQSTALAAGSSQQAPADGNHGPALSFSQTTQRGDFVHPHTLLLMTQPPTKYMLDPAAQKIAGDADAAEEEGAAGSAVGAPPAGGLPAKTPGTAGAKTKFKGGRPPKHSGAAAATPAPPGLGVVAGGSIPSTPAPTDASPVGQHIKAEGAQVGMEDSQPTGLEGGSISSAPHTSAGRVGRARATVNYSLLAGDDGAEQPAQVAETVVKPRGRGGRLKGGTHAAKTPATVGASANGAAAGPLVPAHPLLGPIRQPALGGSKSRQQLGELVDHPLYQAVAGLCAAGGPDRPLSEQWKLLDAAADLLACAPDDEILTEILMLQSELVQQMAINRSRVAPLLLRVLADSTHQSRAAEERRAMEADMRGYLARKAEIKRNQKREQRENQKKAALASIEANGGVPGRAKSRGREGTPAGGSVGPSRDGTPTATEPGSVGDMVVELVDTLAQRQEDEEALCVVCTDGTSVEPNKILFCERCDLAVHQHCYGLADIPEDEWLCWPCSEYERERRAAGVPQEQIRPPRWQLAPGQLEGGSRTTQCVLCPVKHGAFKCTVEGQDWCHLVCALWHSETDVKHGDIKDAITGVRSIKPEKWQMPCTVCHLTQGAVIRCAYSHCPHVFHPLCGRRYGCYLSAKLGHTPSGQPRPVYKAYCLHHSAIMRSKDEASGQLQLALDYSTRLGEPTEAGALAAPAANGGGARGRKDGGGGGPRRSGGAVPAAPAIPGLPDGFALADLGIPGFEGLGAPAALTEGTKPKGGAANKAGAAGRQQAKGQAAKVAGAAGAPAVGATAKGKAGEALGGAQDAQALINRLIHGQSAAPAGGPATLESLAAKEQVYESLRRVRFELEDVRNMVTQVQRREKVSRAVSRDLQQLVAAREADLAGGAAAIEKCEGPGWMSSLGAPTSAALEAAEAFWAKYQQDKSLEQSLQQLGLQNLLPMPGLAGLGAPGSMGFDMSAFPGFNQQLQMPQVQLPGQPASDQGVQPQQQGRRQKQGAAASPAMPSSQQQPQLNAFGDMSGMGAMGPLGMSMPSMMPGTLPTDGPAQPPNKRRRQGTAGASQQQGPGADLSMLNMGNPQAGNMQQVPPLQLGDLSSMLQQPLSFDTLMSPLLMQQQQPGAQQQPGQQGQGAAGGQGNTGAGGRRASKQGVLNQAGSAVPGAGTPHMQDGGAGAGDLSQGNAMAPGQLLMPGQYQQPQDMMAQQPFLQQPGMQQMPGQQSFMQQQQPQLMMDPGGMNQQMLMPGGFGNMQMPFTMDGFNMQPNGMQLGLQPGSQTPGSQDGISSPAGSNAKRSHKSKAEQARMALRKQQQLQQQQQQQPHVQPQQQQQQAPQQLSQNNMSMAIMQPMAQPFQDLSMNNPQQQPFSMQGFQFTQPDQQQQYMNTQFGSGQHGNNNASAMGGQMGPMTGVKSDEIPGLQGRGMGMGMNLSTASGVAGSLDLGTSGNFGNLLLMPPAASGGLTGATGAQGSGLLGARLSLPLGDDNLKDDDNLIDFDRLISADLLGELQPGMGSGALLGQSQQPAQFGSNLAQQFGSLGDGLSGQFSADLMGQLHADPRQQQHQQGQPQQPATGGRARGWPPGRNPYAS